MYSDTTVVIPTLNESAGIDELLETIGDLYSEINVIVADDGSSDGTREIVAKHRSKNQRIRLLDRSQENIHGLAASVIHASDSVDTDYTVVMDGDLQHPPEKLGDIIDALKDSADLVVASREGTGDYFTITVVAIKNGLIYVVDGFRDRLSLFGQTEEIRRLHKMWNPVKIGIEQVGPQKIVVEDLQDRLIGYPIIPVKSSSVNDKLGRVQVLSQLFETGRMFLNPKLVKWIDELASYPRGAHEDTIDSLSFAIQVSRTR